MSRLRAGWARLVLIKQTLVTDAEEPLLRALSILEQSLGPEHVDVGSRLKELAAVYEALGDHQRADEYHTRAQSFMTLTLGADHPEIVESI